MSRFLMGFHALDMLLSSDCSRIRRVYYSSVRRDKRMDDALKNLEERSISIVSCGKSRLSHLVGDDHHQGIVIEVYPLPSCSIDDVLDSCDRPVLLVLDGVTDPHNFGACLRVADATGVTAVVVPKNNSSSLTGVVVKSSSGASEFIRLLSVTNLSRSLKIMYEERGIDVVGTDDNADLDLWSWRPEESECGVAVVLGSEGSGMRRLTRECCRRSIKIPMYGCVGSLNVSVASGVVLYYVRQRLSNG
ncbi:MULTISPECIES: 23S rRNA (guanosine(2251)-2'-O)-methyltransferase RlmB [Candidatus Ichthyocystis]|uniref:23S rRNA (Guanosine-2'-O-)-methyltransferase n=1 Tax=Candidatus Ichthyocystis hellenicum TaxID=1561003 RepID=A0A0S4M1R0_9BURK|nr:MULTISPECIES: 23S rRNA (guanosine(2251)-2'-O)-methyltransferase RlmB [Ichthyocystis]CUT17715.1 23S rRNA (guanosine-2'-O-)-methyltransferase [Candidatus Ichthyocystis hellenicum]